MRQLLLSFLLFHVLATTSAAANLHGVILDPTGHSIAKAAVELSISDGPIAWSGKTNTAGRFTAPLPNGRYRLHVSANGFEEKTISIALSQPDVSTKVHLQLKTQKYSVTVSSQTNTLDTSTEAHQDVISLGAADLQSLPIKDGDVLSALSFFANPAGGQSPTIVIDGMERTDDITLNTSEIQQVRLNNNAYSAEFPKPGKDRIEIDTKGGSDTLHGSFAFRTRNSAVDARNPFAPDNPPFSRYGYEASLEGPILPKRLYFFVSADREEQQQVDPVIAYLPTGVLRESVLAPFTSNLLNGRLDWHINERHQASLRYEFHQDTADNMGVGGFVLPEAGSSRFHHDYRIELSDQYTLSPEALNNFRMALGTNYEQLSSQNNAPSVVVAGAFQLGGAQMDDWRREPRYEFHDTFSLVHKSVTWKAGLEANLHPFRNYSADNFGGTYQFSSLAAYAANQPLLYTLNAGDGLVISQQNDYAWFLQAEKQFSRATLFAGVRHEFQSHFDHYGNLAPRVSLAYALDGQRRTVLRLGAGIFYDRRPPTILQQSLRFNGLNTLQYILENPGPGAIDANSLTPQQTTRYPIDPSMTFPRIYQASVTLERQLPGGFVATADYTYQRGDHLFLTRNINAPLPLTGFRPDPSFGNIDQIESSASSRGNLLNITLKSPGNKWYQFLAQYTLSYLRDNTGDVFGPPPPGGLPAPGTGASNLFALPADNWNLHPEWGPANNDIRHRFGLTASLHLPWRFTLSTLTSIHSGLPYNISTGLDNNHDTDPNDRPPGVTRNTGRGAGYASIDLHLARSFSLEHWGRKIDLEPALDSFNVLNHANPSNYVGVISSPLFGQPNAAYPGRDLQFSVQVHF